MFKMVPSRKILVELMGKQRMIMVKEKLMVKYIKINILRLRENM